MRGSCDASPVEVLNGLRDAQRLAEIASFVSRRSTVTDAITARQRGQRGTSQVARREPARHHRLSRALARSRLRRERAAERRVAPHSKPAHCLRVRTR
jgi:hypothetical protein